MNVAFEKSVDEIREVVRSADAVVTVGARTQWEVGGSPGSGTEIRAPSGILAYEPRDLTVTVGAGATVAELDGLLADSAQECPLDPRDREATVGGVLACGLSGPRRLRHGPIRDRLLEIRLVTGDAKLVKGGGPTVKNVTGFDIPRLVVGSLGTLGVLVQCTLRCQPRAPAARWSMTTGDPSEVMRRSHRPSTVLWDGRYVHVLLEGQPDDSERDERTLGLEPAPPPDFPTGRVRGRISISPRSIEDVAARLRAIEGLRWLAEVGVGTVHVASDEARFLHQARKIATASGGWMLREAGMEVDPFGLPLPNVRIHQRLKRAFDPEGKLNPGRLPL